MKQNKYYLAAVILAVMAVLFISMSDIKTLFGILGVACLMGASEFSTKYHELKHIRSNADEDRPE